VVLWVVFQLHAHLGCPLLWYGYQAPAAARLLQDVGCGVGGHTVAVILEALARDLSQWGAGLPDLVLWRRPTAADSPTTATSTNRDVKHVTPDGAACVLVEVKCRDRLSPQQMMWLRHLRRHNVPVAVAVVAPQPCAAVTPKPPAPAVVAS